MTDDEYEPVALSRRIAAPARHIFRVLADPARHPDFDGSQSLRGPASPGVIPGAGDAFVMKMHYPHLGDYEMNNHVVEYEQDRRIGVARAPVGERPGLAPEQPPHGVGAEPGGAGRMSASTCLYAETCTALKIGIRREAHPDQPAGVADRDQRRAAPCPRSRPPSAVSAE
jgi:hypothetical protein